MSPNHSRRRIIFLASVTLLIGSTMGPLDVAQAATPTGVVINEVRCDDVKPDFVELYNAGSVSVNLNGWKVADHLGNLGDAYHVKTLGSITLGSKKYMRVYKGLRTIDFQFNISCGDDSVKLATVAKGVATTIDSVEIPPIDRGFSWGRLSSARNGWGATIPTPGTANKAVPTGVVYDPSSWIFNPYLVKRIDLTLPTATVTNFQNGNPGKVYQTGSFVMTNQSDPSPTPNPIQVGIRLKVGFGSYKPFGSLAAPSKSSFKIKFDTIVAGQSYFGLNKLTLNNMTQDPSLVHEWASYAIFRAMGIPCPRVGYASVYINNVYWGFYLTLEPYDDVSLSWRYPSTQHLYEGLWTDRPSDLSPGRATIAYQIDEGSSTNRGDLEGLITALNSFSISSPQVGKYLNVDEVAQHMAIEQYLDHWDGYTSMQWWTPNNYYLHSDRTGLFELLPWGTDQTFSGNAANFSNAIGTLFSRCILDDYCKSQYLQAIAQVSKTANELKLDQTISTIMTIQKNGITADVRRGISYLDTVSASTGVSTHIKNATTQASAYLSANAKGEIHWALPESLQAGTYLPATFFKAYSDVAGTMKYSVTAGKYLKSGTLKVTVTFTPTDFVNYSPKTKVYSVPVVS